MTNLLIAVTLAIFSPIEANEPSASAPAAKVSLIIYNRVCTLTERTEINFLGVEKSAGYEESYQAWVSYWDIRFVPGPYGIPVPKLISRGWSPVNNGNVPMPTSDGFMHVCERSGIHFFADNYQYIESSYDYESRLRSRPDVKYKPFNERLSVEAYVP